MYYKIYSERDERNSEAQFMVPDWGDKVDYGIGFSYWPPGYIGRRVAFRQLYALFDFIPQSETMNLATGLLFIIGSTTAEFEHK